MENRARDRAEGRLEGRDAVRLDALLAYCESLRGALKASYGEADKLRQKTLGLLPSMDGRYHLNANTPLHELTPAAMDRLVSARRAEGNKAQTIAHELRLLRAAARHAAALGQRVPAMMTDGSLKNPWRLPAVAQKTRYLSQDEWQRVFDYMDPLRLYEDRGVLIQARGLILRQRQDAQDLLVASTMTGGRWSEVAGMT